MSKLIKKVSVAVFAAVAAVLCASSAWAATVEVTTWAELVSELGKGNSVQLKASFTQTSDQVSVTDAKKKLTVDLNGYTITGVAEYRMFSFASKGGTLTLKDTSKDKTGTLQGPDEVWTGDKHGSCLHVKAGTVTMYDITIKRWNKTTEYCNGGAIWLESSDSKFVMNSGVIEDCSTMGKGAAGGAIYMGVYGTDNQSAELEINGGIIRNCSAKSAGGAIYARPPDSSETSYRPKLTIRGGAYYGNKYGTTHYHPIAV